MPNATVHKVSTAWRDEIYVTDSAGTAVTGLVNANFTKLLTADGAASSETVTVTEINSSTRAGMYSVTFTPTSSAEYALVVTHATYNPYGWQSNFIVNADGPWTLDEMLDSASEVDTYTLRQIFRLMAAFGGGKSSGGASDDVIRSISDSKDRITATLDSNGHRTAVTLDLT